MCGWKDNLKRHLKEVGYDAVDKSQVVQIRDWLLKKLHVEALFGIAQSV